MKARTMVYLEREQLRALKTEAHEEGISLAELIRRIVRAHIGKRDALAPPARDTFLRIVALGRSGCRDVSERHDEYLGGILRDEHSR